MIIQGAVEAPDVGGVGTMPESMLLHYPEASSLHVGPKVYCPLYNHFRTDILLKNIHGGVG